MDLQKNFYKKILKNGMTIIFEKRNLPVVSVVLAVRAGGINESVEEKGISHFIEHMLYKGTKKRSHKQIAEEIEKNGGELNGFTSDEITGYYCKMPSKHLHIALNVLTDMIKNSLFDEKELEKERKVIFEEIKMYKDNPQLHCISEIQKLLYSGTLGMELAGTFESMANINRKKFLEKFKQIYEPNNFILCVVGNAELDEIVKFAEKNFGNKKSKIPKQKFELKNQSKIEEREGVEQANLVFAYHVPAASDERCYAAKILSSLMTGGVSSKLFQEIREKRNLAYGILGDSNINRDFAYNFIYAGAMKENIEQIKKIILEEFEKVSKQLSEKELKEIKEQMIGNYQISMEDSQTQMMNLLISEISGEAKDFYEYEKNISAVKLNDVKELAKKAVKAYSFFVLVPKGKKDLSDYTNYKMENYAEIGKGWQFAVYGLGNDKVLKKQYSNFEKFYLIKEKQIKKGKPYSALQILFSILRVNMMAKDSNKYMKNLSAKFNLSFLGNPIFDGSGGYEQDKVLLLEEIFRDSSLDYGKKLFDQYISLILETWKYGFSDIMFNFLENNGINRNGKLIQSDFGEITFNKNKVLDNIKNKKWLKANCFRAFPEGELKEYYASIMEREMTAKSLDSFWRYNL